MRGIGRLCMGLMLAALMLLVWPSLVQEPTGDAAETRSAALPVVAALGCARDLPAESAQAVLPQSSPERPRAAAVEAQTEQPVVRVLCDGNGWILRSRSWVR